MVAIPGILTLMQAFLCQENMKLIPMCDRHGWCPFSNEGISCFEPYYSCMPPILTCVNQTIIYWPPTWKCTSFVISQ